MFLTFLSVESVWDKPGPSAALFLWGISCITLDLGSMVFFISSDRLLHVSVSLSPTVKLEGASS